MTSNKTNPPHVIPPLTGISESERDKYLLIATFLSVLIIFGVLVAIMHRKCRETLSKTKSWVISKTVRHRPNINRNNARLGAIEMSFRDPSSPVFSKEINPPLMFYLGSSDESQSGRTRKSRGQRSSGTDQDSGISIISGCPNIPMCSLSNQCVCFDKDVNDNVTVSYDPPIISQESVRLVRVLAPEIKGKTSAVTSTDDINDDKRPKLRRSSTVIDKMNYLQGYMPSSRDDDYTVITLTDDSEPDNLSPDILLNKFKYNDTIHLQGKGKRSKHLSGVDNPAFYLQNKILSKSLSDIRASEDERSMQKSTLPNGSTRHIGKKDKLAYENIVHVAEVHAPLKMNRCSNMYKKSQPQRTNKRPTAFRTYNIKTIDKESQELYKRVMRERINDIIRSDSSASSVKSDQTFVRSNRKKKRKTLKSASSTNVL
ncbi:Hypothetical predicted protein [Mytilus galloprovincialis]|uniref:Uncharacterized protein n=1 Tax=Mytilus galloprovincialis TaxID=29158 RepID=A0A8B6DF36_MYTGA|nr:Hypothetical predicted protein [Mytilus galloprovincialis]